MVDLFSNNSDGSANCIIVAPIDVEVRKVLPSSVAINSKTTRVQ